MAKSTIPVNLYVPIECNRTIERWLAREVVEGRARLGEISRNAIYEKVLEAEVKRIGRLLDRPSTPPPEPDGEREQVNMGLPADAVQRLDAYVARQQEVHGHTRGTMSRAKLIVAALCREAERLRAEMETKH